MQSIIFKELDDNISHPKDKLNLADGELKNAFKNIETKVNEIVDDFNKKMSGNSQDLKKDLYEIQKKINNLFFLMQEGLNLDCKIIDAKMEVKEIEALKVLGISGAIGITAGLSFTFGGVYMAGSMAAGEIALGAMAFTGIGAFVEGALGGLGFGIYKAVKHFTKEDDLVKGCIKIKEKCRQNINEQREKLNSNYDEFKKNYVANFNQQFNFFFQKMSNQ